MENPHIALRPSWNCCLCGDPWPCHPAKGRLLIEYRHAATSLGLYLAIQWIEASKDLENEVLSDELWSRFIGWHRPSLRDISTEE